MPDFGRWTSNGGDPSLNEINRTDRFLDALAFDQQVYATDHSEAELAHLLAGWRDEVRDAPLTATVTPRDAVIAFEGARASRKRGRTLAIVGSAAAAVLCLGGFVSVVAGAGPGDSLYGLHTMFFGEEQRSSDTAVMLASQQLAEVQQLIDEGQWEAAQDKLQTLTTTVATVDDTAQKQELVSQWQELTVKVEQQNPEATIPPDVAPPSFPDVPVVVAPGSDTATTTSPPSDAVTTTPSPSDTTTTSPPSDATTTTSAPTTTTSVPTTTTSAAETTTSAQQTTTSSAADEPVQQLPRTTTTTTVVVPRSNPQTAVQTAPASPASPPAPAQAPPAVVEQPAQPTAPKEAPAQQPAPKEEPAPKQEPKSEVTTTVVVPEPAENPGNKPN